MTWADAAQLLPDVGETNFIALARLSLAQLVIHPRAATLAGSRLVPLSMSVLGAGVGAWGPGRGRCRCRGWCPVEIGAGVGVGVDAGGGVGASRTDHCRFLWRRMSERASHGKSWIRQAG
jgi:hypothetical protein